MMKDYDFCGWATKNDIMCSDGRIIRRDAFKHNDGMSVPLVYSHKHDTIANVLGHAILVNKPNGMYAYGYLNHSSEGEAARERVKNKDITRMSIYATQVRQNGADVIHGDIKEVSLVISGANPGATIETVLSHSDIGIDEESVIIKTGEDICMSDPEMEAVREEETEGEVIEHADEKKEEAAKESDAEEEEDDGEGKTIGDVLDTMTPLQKRATYALVKEFLDALKPGNDDDDEDEDEDEEGEDAKHDDMEDDMYISQSDIDAAFADLKRYGTMKSSFEAHGIGDIVHADEVDEPTYGIGNIGYLFPDSHNLNPTPEIINYEDDWVNVVLNGVHRTPFSRVKSMFADITPDEARAKGYLKTKKKTEEVISLLKRETGPTTIYKKQKFDRDDLIDADIDVISFIKAEMKQKLNEEIARAILFSDGRKYSSDDKINEMNVRPIVTDSSLYTINWAGHYEVPSTAKSRQEILEFTQQGGLIPDFILRDIIRGSRAARTKYRGSGNPIMFCSSIMHESFLLMEDKRGHLLYEDDEKLRKVLRVSRIVTVPDEVLPITNTYDAETGVGRYSGVFALIVNLNDYNVGMDRKGAVAMFDDFDIDYNQQKYLIETRMSGALVKPYSAIAMSLNITFPEETQPEEITLDDEVGDVDDPLTPPSDPIV